jgi:hypothetical protein
LGDPHVEDRHQQEHDQACGRSDRSRPSNIHSFADIGIGDAIPPRAQVTERPARHDQDREHDQHGQNRSNH